MDSSFSRQSSLLERVSELPELPGVYQYLDSGGAIIYVGKAKNLRRRVASYFLEGANLTPKTRVLVSKIRDLRFIVVDTESDALLLENSLIKQHRPRYNVLLKDDKTYPWIAITNEAFPRVISTRRVVKDGTLYYGPFTSAYMVKTLLALVHQLFQLRTCRKGLTVDSVAQHKWKVCLEFHIKNCKAPCVGLQSEADYLEDVDQVKRILRGDFHLVTRFLTDQMSRFASSFRFEEAETVKQKLLLLEKFQRSSVVVDTRFRDLDVFSLVDDLKSAYVHFLKVRNGAIVQSYSLELVKRMDEPSEELLLFAVLHIRELLESSSSEIVVPFSISMPDNGCVVTVPKTGDKKRLLDLSLKNVKAFQLERHNQTARLDPGRHVQRILSTLQRDLRLPAYPLHIECFDNSNLLGNYPVSACVVFKEGKPSKADYRHYHVKSVQGANDFATMEEILERRFSRLMAEKKSLPQLVVVDGGKGQLSSALKIFDKLGIRHTVSLVGLAERLEEIYFPDDPVPLYLDKNSESLKLIQNLRNEAHRFGITFHRKVRSKGMLDSFWETLPGLGNSLKERLMQHFRTPTALKAATVDELAALLGPKRGAKLFAQLKAL
ncbi:MAG: excinuclease ABC subunit UvrC [Bacteroidales bacterium]